MGQDGLFFELEFLEDVWFQGLLWFYQERHDTISMCINDLGFSARLTSPDELQGTQCKSEDDSVRNPFALDDEGAEHEQSSWDVDPVNVLLGAQRFFGRHDVRCCILFAAKPEEWSRW